MPPEPLLDEDYASEEDSDFSPEAAPAEGASESSDSEDDDADEPTAATAKRKFQTDGKAASDGFENSGWEVAPSQHGT